MSCLEESLKSRNDKRMVFLQRMQLSGLLPDWCLTRKAQERCFGLGRWLKRDETIGTN